MTYYCYLLTNDSNNRTYIGVTNNLDTRILQHNKIKKNGAKSTRSGKNWKYHHIVGPLATKASAQVFEYYVKHIQNKSGKWVNTPSGLENKTKRFVELMAMDEWNHLTFINY